MEDKHKREYSIYDENDNVVAECKRFYDSTAAIEWVNQGFPDGLPEGWSLVDETAKVEERLKRSIKECHPSFKITGIELDGTDVEVSRSDMYLVVPFSYRGKEYFYREHAGEGWVESVAKAVVDKVIADASFRSGGDKISEKRAVELDI